MVLDVVLSIIVVDLLSHYGLVVECCNKSLLDVFTSLSTPGLIAPISSPSLDYVHLQKYFGKSIGHILCI